MMNINGVEVLKTVEYDNNQFVLCRDCLGVFIRHTYIDQRGARVVEEHRYNSTNSAHNYIRRRMNKLTGKAYESSL